MNPMSVLKLKNLLSRFKENHPKVPLFLKAASGTITEGAVVELKITSAEGQTLVTNIRVNEQDMELINELKNLA